jgi:hypothetical protein
MCIGLKIADKLGLALDYNEPAKKQVERREENKERRTKKWMVH